MKATQGDRVALTDANGTHAGTVMVRNDTGMCSVKWDSGVTERIHELALTPADENGDAYDTSDPKHPSFIERLSALFGK